MAQKLMQHSAARKVELKTFGLSETQIKSMYPEEIASRLKDDLKTATELKDKEERSKASMEKMKMMYAGDAQQLKITESQINDISDAITHYGLEIRKIELLLTKYNTEQAAPPLPDRGGGAGPPPLPSRASAQGLEKDAPPPLPTRSQESLAGSVPSRVPIQPDPAETPQKAKKPDDKPKKSQPSDAVSPRKKGKKGLISPRSGSLKKKTSGKTQEKIVHALSAGNQTEWKQFSLTPEQYKLSPREKKRILESSLNECKDLLDKEKRVRESLLKLLPHYQDNQLQRGLTTKQLAGMDVTIAHYEREKTSILENLNACNEEIARAAGNSSGSQGADNGKVYAMALYDFNAENEGEVTVTAGEEVEVIDEWDPDSDWTFVKTEVTQQEGFVATQYIALIEDDE